MLGFPVLRLRGDYLAIVTLAFGEIIRVVLINWTSFTGGPNDVPEAYTRNSPQNFAQNLSIPFMLLSNDRDGAVDFNQGVTYYNHLRDLGKDVILLEYAGENHGLARPANQKDYNLRMTEWFDTFLRDQPAPDWL